MQLTLPLTTSTPKPELKLRDYQQESVDKVINHWQGCKNVLVQQPTGAGKSLIIAAIAQKAISQNQRILAIAHKVELIRQLRDHFSRWLNTEVGVIADKSQFRPNPQAQIQVASIQALNCKPPHQLPPAKLVIVDEAHHSHARSYAKIFSHYTNARFLGLTATPQRIDGRGLRFLHGGVPGFEQLVTGVPVRELIELGYLCDFKIFSPEQVFDPVGIKTQGGDYHQGDLEEAAEKILISGEVVDTWLKYAKGKRTVLYPVSVKLSKQYCQEFCDRQIPAAHIDAGTPPKERQQIIEKFRRGEVLVLCQHSIVIEGVDIPGIECVQFARPTRSLTIWFQAIGRALRPAPGKSHAIVIDHTTTHQNLPWVDDPIDWSLDPISLPEGTKHAQNCPNCGHIFRASQHEIKQLVATCPSCQNQFSFEVREGNGEEKGGKEVEIVEADFQERKRELNPEVMAKIDSIFAQQKKYDYKPAWAAYRALEIPNIGYFELLEVAKRLKYKTGWAWFKFEELKAARQQQKVS